MELIAVKKKSETISTLPLRVISVLLAVLIMVQVCIQSSQRWLCTRNQQGQQGRKGKSVETNETGEFVVSWSPTATAPAEHLSCVSSPVFLNVRFRRTHKCCARKSRIPDGYVTDRRLRTRQTAHFAQKHHDVSCARKDPCFSASAGTVYQEGVLDPLEHCR